MATLCCADEAREDDLRPPEFTSAETPFTLAPCPLYVSMSELRARGWSHSMVKALLGTHDSLDASVPHPKRARRLWSLERTRNAECSDEYLRRKEMAERRSTQQKTILQRTSIAVIEAARSVAINVMDVPLDYTIAVKRTAEANAVMEFIDVNTGMTLGWECLAVEYLLQASAPVEDMLDDYFGRPGVKHARSIIKERLLDAIADRFPELANECARRKCCD